MLSSFINSKCFEVKKKKKNGTRHKTVALPLCKLAELKLGTCVLVSIVSSTAVQSAVQKCANLQHQLVFSCNGRHAAAASHMHAQTDISKALQSSCVHS